LTHTKKDHVKLYKNLEGDGKYHHREGKGKKPISPGMTKILLIIEIQRHAKREIFKIKAWENIKTELEKIDYTDLIILYGSKKGRYGVRRVRLSQTNAPG